MVTITVTNLDEPGSVTVMPAPVAGIASTAEVTDPDGTVANVTSWTWEVAETQDAVIWTTAAGTGAATDTYTPVTAETGKWLRVTAVYPDPVFTTAATVRAVVGPVRAANPQAGFPDDDNGGLGDGTADPVSFSVEENAAATTVVGTVMATDGDGDTLTYTVTGTDATAFAETFALNANSGEITVKAGGTVDFETKPSYVITVNVSDGQDGDGQADNAIDDMVMVTITVTNLNEPGSVTVMPAPVAGIASTADVTDPDGTVPNVTSWAWEVAETQDSAIWTTAAGTGAATDTYTPVTAETGKWLRVTAVYPDPVFTTAATVRAVVGPVRAANPQAGFPDDDNGGLGDGTADPVSFSVEENAAATTVVGTVMATDTDGDTLTYTVTGTDATAFAETFALNANSGEITVKAGGTVDFETKPSYVITVNVSDGQDGDGQADNAIDDMVMVTITVTNLNEPGSVTVMPAPVAGIASTADVTDPDGTVANVTSWAWEVAETQDSAIWTTAAGTGAATDTYTPVTAETGKWLRVTAVYPDPVFTTAATVRAVVGPVGATVTVSFGSSTYTVVEGASVTVTVDLDVDPERTVSIPITATSEDGATSSDYSGVPPNVTFSSGETAKTFNFMATQDRQDDDGERVRLAFGTFPAGVSAGSPDETVVSITDDDVPEVIVSPDTVPVPEGGSSRYSVVLSTEPAGTVTVTVIDPTDNTDVTADPSTLTFTSSNWESAQYVTVSAISDDDFMDDTATVTHAVSGYGSVIDALSVTVTVNDDESAVALVTNLGESLDGTYTFGANHRVSMIFRTGLHSLGYIFTGLVFDVQTAAPDEMTFTVILAEYDRIANAQSNPVTLTGEFTATGEVYFTPESPVALSRNQWYLVFLQSSYDGPLTGNALGQLSATSSDMETTQPGDTNWVIGNTRSDTDLDNLGSVQINTQTLRFAVQGRKVDLNPPMGAPTISGNLVVGEPLTADTSAITDTDGLTMVTYAYEWFRVDGEKNETLIEGATQSTYLLTNEDIGSTMKVRVTFRDDATNPHQLESEETGVVTPLAVAVSFGASTYTVVEGGTVTVTVTLDVDPERTVVIPITATNQGGATNVDYSGVPPDVTFNSGDTSQTVTITATDDSGVDGGESIKLGFGTLPAKVTEGSTDETTVSITDNDVAGVTVNPTTVTVAEGGTATYQVKLNTLPAGTVTVTINDPTDNTDVTAVTPSLSFDSTNWDTFQDVTVRAAEDGDADDDTATVTHTVSGYGTVTTADSVTVSVTDNEPAVEVSFGASTYTVAEGGTVTVAVTLDVDPERTVVVPITVTNQGGATNVDYSGVPPDVTFNSGDTSQTVTITATDDSVVDGGESIKLGFGTLPAKVTEGSTDETTVSITDNDVAGVTVNPTTVTVAEGETATYQVKLNTLPAGTVTVTINDPTDNTDVTAVTVSLSFDSTNWDTFQDVTVRAAEDGDAEDDTATVTHTVSGYGTVTTADSVTVSVTDNEPAVEVSFGASTYTVAEGGTVTVAVTLDVDPERTVVIPITVTNQGGASAEDYSRVPPNVTFNSGDTSQTVTITATDDSGVDGGESIKLGFGTLPAKVTEGSTDETTVSITDNDVAGVTVNPTTLTVAEGGTATYQVKLNTLPAGTVIVTINDPTDNTVVTAVTPSLSFDSTNWDTFQDVTVRAAEDDDADDDTATVTHTVSGYGTVTTADSVTVSVTDNEPAVEVSFGASTYTVAEGGTVTVAVTLDVDPERTVVVPITVTNQGGATNVDYSGVPPDVTFNSGDTSQTVTITATDDSVVDGGESIKLGFGTLPAKVTEGSTDETTVSITDNDVAGVTVNPTTVTVAEGGTATYQVKLNTLPAGTVTVTINDPTDNTDVTAVTVSLSFDSTNWDTFQDVTVRAAEDGDADDDTATVTHTVSGYGTVTTADSVTVSVTDNEPAVEVSFGASTYTVAEGGTVTVAVTLDVDPERTVVIPITVTNQGGASAEDYSRVPPNVTFNSGDTSQTVTITATDDSGVDGGESIKLGFGTLPAKVTEGSTDETTVSITDNDVAGVTVNPTTLTVAEGETATYQVKLNTLPAGTVTVTINDPTDNTDVTAVTVSLSFDSTNWDTFQDVTVRAAEDDDADDDTATVTHTVSGYGTVTTADSVTVSVTDNEPAVEVSFGASTYTVAEGGTVTVTVTLDVDPERTVVVPITVTNQGGATNVDYSGVPPDVTFSSGDTSQTVTITATDDSSVDGGESIKLGFGTLPAKVTEGSTDETTVSITDNDVAGVTVNPTAVTVAEGGTATYQVKLNTLPAGTVTVTINDPTDNTDVTAVTVSLSFDSTNWDTFQDVTVRAAEDGDAEDDTATVTHTVSGYGTVTTADSVTVSVTDNEPAVEVSFGASTYTVAEGGTVTVAVTLDVDPERTVVVPITVTNQGGATADVDYSGVPPDVTFNSGDTSQTVTITATDDSVDDGGESIKLGFGTLPAKVTEGSPDETTVSITDNDVAGVTVNPTTVTVAEGETATYQVKLNTLPAGTVTVTINDPTDNTDVTAVTVSLSFDSTNWDTFQDVTVRAAEDGDAEDDTATVTHTVSGYGTVTTADSVTVSVTDNEPAVEVSFGARRPTRWRRAGR